MTSFYIQFGQIYYEVCESQLFAAYKTARAEEAEAIDLAYLLSADLDVHEGTPSDYIQSEETTQAQALALYWRMQPAYWIENDSNIPDFQEFEHEWFQRLSRNLQNGFYKSSSIGFDPLVFFQDRFKKPELSIIPEFFKQKIRGREIDFLSVYKRGDGGFPSEVSALTA
ncbi:hypothetical protein [Deinococcus fonticola]|uniref:hypothetical protein n=1 Tax=Deinococcus fonticola TaxID=2528713 RepID=UPI0010755407|nr:hypothetical protein [Deinococcus fonticola]